MSLLATARSLWRHVSRRSDVEASMAAEMESHILMRADDLAATRGLSRDEAIRQARIEFGALDKHKEDARQSLGLRLLDQCRGDLRYAGRTLRRSRGFALAAVATLAVGIGANVAIFSLINAVMFRPLPVDRPEHLLSVMLKRPDRPAPNSGFTNAFWEALRDNQDAFSGVFAWSQPITLEFSSQGAVRPAQVLIVSGDYFPVLGIAPRAGRLLAGRDDTPGCAPVAVLNESFAARSLSGSSEVVGQTITLGQQPFEVVGVSPARFPGLDMGKRFDVAIPICASALLDKRNVESRGRHWLHVMGRLDPGLTIDDARTRLAQLSPAVMRASIPAGDEDYRQKYLQGRLLPAAAGIESQGRRQRLLEPLHVLMGLVALVLVIACANLAALLLARAATRQRELAVRVALGASRSRLVRQLLTETAVIAVAGGSLGIALARWGGTWLVRALSTGAEPFDLDLSLDGRVLAFTLVLTMATMMLVGLLPARRAARRALIDAMKARTTAGERHSSFAAGRWIVTGQVALSLVLLVAGGLLLRSFVNLMALDPGFAAENVMVVSAKAPRFAADTSKLSAAEKPAVYDAFAQRLDALPGVSSVSRAYVAPIGRDNWVSNVVVDRLGAPTGRDATSYFNYVMPGYFRTMRMTRLAGRDFTVQDRSGTARVAIVNESMAQRFFPSGSPIGARFRVGGDTAWVEVVGLVRDARYESVRADAPPTVFLPGTQMPDDASADEFVIRTAVPPTSLVTPIRQIARDVSPNLNVTFETMTQRLDDDLARERLIATLATGFGLSGIALAMIGLYGVLGYLVAQRQSEFGLRLAIGAPPRSVLRLVMVEVLFVLVAGLAVGMAATLPATTLLGTLLFDLQARDAGTLAGAALLLAIAVLLAGYLPARRATRIDPAEALRSE